MPSTMRERMIGAATLDVDAFEEVEHDASATGQAAAVVALAAVAQGMGAAAQGVGAMVGFVVSAFVGWALWAGVTYLIGDKLLGGDATWGELLRTLGFAQAPGILLFLAILPLVGGLVQLGVGLWVLVAGFIGLRQALDLDNRKTLLTVVLGWVALVLPPVLLGVLAG